MTQKNSIIFLLILLFWLIGCQTSTTNDNTLNGRITVWHKRQPPESLVLETALNTFQEANPQVEIVSVYIPPDQFLDEFKDSAKDGLAPDLIIGSEAWLPELAEAGLIRPFEPTGTILALERYATLTQYQGKSYGLPFSLSPQALYYSKALVENPVTTLDDLLAAARKGDRIGFVPLFVPAYWGIEAFGEGLFDAEGNFTLAESGFVEWLTWLDDAQPIAGVIMSTDETSLRERFIQGDLHYYVAGPEELDTLRESMGDDAFGVTLLPAGPIGSAGPLLTAQLFMFYAHSTKEQSQIANALARFFASQQQSNLFMRELEIIPANPAVRVDPRLYPYVSGFARQARTGTALPNELDKEQLYTAGNEAYINVLSEQVTPEEAVCTFGQQVAAISGMSGRDINLPDGCELPDIEPDNS
ncbi:MAG: extracellular solute-binding protein [Anaerolineales bacterium]|nr:extracellular solute-binding protein [Anaerolineales bacterium]